MWSHYHLNLATVWSSSVFAHFIRSISFSFSSPAFSSISLSDQMSDREKHCTVAAIRESVLTMSPSILCPSHHNNSPLSLRLLVTRFETKNEQRSIALHMERKNEKRNKKRNWCVARLKYACKSIQAHLKDARAVPVAKSHHLRRGRRRHHHQRCGVPDSMFFYHRCCCVYIFVVVAVSTLFSIYFMLVCPFFCAAALFIFQCFCFCTVRIKVVVCSRTSNQYS